MKLNRKTTGKCTLKSLSRLPEVYATPVPNDNKYRLNRDFTFGDFTIPKGYKWDGATIPRIFWSVIGSPFQPKFMRASLIHDYLYNSPEHSGKCIDSLFKQILIADGVSRTEANIMYASVRAYRILVMSDK